MQATTRIKLLLKRSLPGPLFSIIYFIASKTILKLLLFLFKLSVSNFNKVYVKKIEYKDFNFLIEINPKNGFLDAQIHANGLYEPHIVEVMKENIRPDSVCIDIGANIGHHTVLMARFAKNGHVHAYEPIPEIRQQLERTLTHNRITNVSIHQTALSDTDKESVLYLRTGNIGGSSLVSGKDTEELPVRLTTLDNENLGRVDFMKIDVEGYEYHVLKGADILIQKNRPIIVFEWSPVYYRIYNESHTKDILQFFTKHSYTLTDIEDQGKVITDLDSFIKGFDTGLRSQTNILATPL